MKLFVAVVMFVSVSITFAADIVWESGWPRSLAPQIDPHKFMPIPGGKIAVNTQSQVQTQDSQQNPQGAVFLPGVQPPADECGEQRKAFADKEEERLQLLREANCIQRRVIAGGKIATWWQRWFTIVQAAIALFALGFTAWNVRIATRNLTIGNRAYLLVKHWMVNEKLRDGTEARVFCFLLNAGRTPATLEKRGIKCEVRADPPQPLTPRSLNDVARLEMPVNAQGEQPMNCLTEHIGTEKFRGLKDKTQFLYARICFVYADVFGNRYWVISSARYDMDIELFVAINEPDYNCHGIYREEDWT